VAVRRLLDHEVGVPEAIVRALEDAGVEYVFGMPGGRTGAIFDALYDHRATIRTVLVREEGLAHEPAQAVQDTQLAIKHALAGPPGPVAVLYRSAALSGSVGPETTPRLYATQPYLPTRAAGADNQQPAVVDVVTSTAVTFRDVTSPLAAYPAAQAPVGRR
jgi:glyoxylate carboligase